MVAEEGERPLDNRLLVVLVGDFIDELGLGSINFGPLPYNGRVAGRIAAVEFRGERIEHPVEVGVDVDKRFALFHPDELEIDRGFLHSAAMDRHLEHLFIYHFPEPLLGKLLVGGDIDMDDKGAVVLGFDPEDALPALAELESQVVEIQFIIHLLGPDCQDLQPGEFLRVGRPDPEVGRDEDLLLDFFGGSLCGIITNDYAVASHIGTDPMDPADLFHPGLEGHGTAVALDGFEVFNLNRLQFHPFRNVPALVNCRELKLRP